MGRESIISVTGLLYLLTVLIGITACDTNQSVGLQDSLSMVPDLQLIKGAENTSITVNNGTDSYFSVDLANIAANDQVQEGNSKGWCIAWNKPIASDNARHDGLKLYSSYGDENWRPVNYLLNIKPHLESVDPDLTYREIQAAIWTLMDFPKFDLNQIRIEQLPDRLVRNGQYNFDKQKVDQIVTHVKQNYESFRYNGASTYAVVVETPSDTQTIIVEVGGSAWAYGQLSFRGKEYKELFDVTVPGQGKWGWIYELDAEYASTELISGGGEDDGTKAADEVGTIIGSLDMNRDGNQLDITYSAHSGYLVNDLHLWVGCPVTSFPTTGAVRNPSLNRFQFTYDSDPTASHTFSVNLSDYNCSGSVYISAHAGKLYTFEHVELPIEEAPQFTITSLRGEYGLTVAWDINDHGDIVGANSYWNSTTNTLINMGNIFARSMNNNGQVVGDNAIWDIDTGITDLGLIPEDANWLNDDSGRWLETEANDLNESGQVVGNIYYEEFLFEDCFYLDEDEEDYYCDDIFDYGQRAFYWDPGMGKISLKFNDDSDPIGDSGEAVGINNDGWVVGSDGGSFIWNKQDGMRSLDISDPVAINNNGQILGRSQVLHYSGASVTVEKRSSLSGGHHNLIDILHRLTRTDGIYDFGHVADMIRHSIFKEEAFLWQKNMSTGLSRSKVTEPNMSWDANTEIEIMDIVQNSTYHSEGFVYSSDGERTDIGSLGGSWTAPQDMNDHGQVVGYGDIGGGESRAFFWDPEFGMIELPTLGGNSLARALNNEGQIVGYSYDTNGQFNPVMWEITNGAAKFASN